MLYPEPVGWGAVNGVVVCEYKTAVMQSLPDGSQAQGDNIIERAFFIHKKS